MQMDILQLGLLGANCYLLWEDRDCAVIDPGGGAKQILSELDGRGLILRAICLTHGHFDHVGAVNELAQATGCRVFFPETDTVLPDRITSGPIAYTDLYSDGARICCGAIELTAIHTPGHTPGSSCLRTGNWLFTGDTLFRGSVGRTDLPGGDGQELAESLRRLCALEGDLFVYPGHGDATTLDRERKSNPYLRGAMER